MANTVFENIDFGFRRGSAEALKNTSVANGTWNIATDKCELSVDIDNIRIPLSSVLIYETEDEILAIPNPANKFYYAEDTANFMHFNTKDLEWKTISQENVKFARLAKADEKGRVFEEYYESIVDANSNFNEINKSINDIKASVAKISSFDIIILQPDEELPDEGLEHTIYFVPQTEITLKDNEYDEYIWLSNAGFFEKIGITTPDFTDYYKKSEADVKFSEINTKVDNHITETDSKISEIEETVKKNNTYISSSNENYTELDGRVKNNYAELTEKIKQINATDDTQTQAIDDIQQRFDNYYTKSETDTKITEAMNKLGFDSGLYSVSENGDIILDYGEETDEESN